ncbi:MAG: hypothetical protein H6573_15355 [Lewinellaceae bacterium]|nr:hypothetical protein [Lewinellaceae bacterium]
MLSPDLQFGKTRVVLLTAPVSGEGLFAPAVRVSRAVSNLYRFSIARRVSSLVLPDSEKYECRYAGAYFDGGVNAIEVSQVVSGRSDGCQRLFPLGKAVLRCW